MLLASSKAAFNTSFLPPSTTFATSQSPFASAAENWRVDVQFYAHNAIGNNLPLDPKLLFTRNYDK